MGPYFSLYRDTWFVSGACRGALYHLASGDIYSVDAAGREILQLICAGVRLEDISPARTSASTPDEVLRFLGQLQDMGLGAPTPQPNQFRPGDPQFPPKKLRKVWIELTDGCNLRCLHCYADARPLARGRSPDGPRLTCDAFKQVLHDAGELGARWVQFIGGEPLIVGIGELGDLISTARRASFDVVEIFTNGTLLTDAHVDLFARHDVSIAVSVYSCDADVHDRMTGVPGSFQRTAKALELLRRRGLPLRIGVTVTSLNAETEAKTLAWVRKSFPGAFVTSDVIRCTRCGRNGQASLLTADLVARRLRTNPDFPKVSRDMFERALSGHSCLDEELCVSARGKVYPCIMERTEVLGDLRTQTLQDIVTGPKTQDVWRLSKDHFPVCSDCEYRYGCADCPPMAKTLFEMLNGCPPDGPVKDPLCTYDPHGGTWGNSDLILERLCPRGHEASGISTREKGGFDHGRDQESDESRSAGSVLANGVHAGGGNLPSTVGPDGVHPKPDL